MLWSGLKEPGKAQASVLFFIVLERRLFSMEERIFTYNN